MATFSTTYAGKDAAGLLGKAIASVASFAQGGFMIDENARGKAVLRLVDQAAAGWVADDGTFADQADLAFDDKAITLVYRKINEVIKKTSLSVDWLSVNKQAGAIGGLSGADQAKIVEEVIRLIAAATDSLIWASIITEVNADSDVNDVSIATLTSANVVAQLSLIAEDYADLTNNVGEAQFYMHPSNVAKLNTAQSGLGTNDARGFKADNFGGYKIISSLAIPDAKILLTPKENMHFAIDRYSDLSAVRILDQSQTTGANVLHIVANAALAASYARGAEIVLATAS